MEEQDSAGPETRRKSTGQAVTRPSAFLGQIYFWAHEYRDDLPGPGHAPPGVRPAQGAAPPRGESFRKVEMKLETRFAFVDCAASPITSSTARLRAGAVSKLDVSKMATRPSRPLVQYVQYRPISAGRWSRLGPALPCRRRRGSERHLEPHERPAPRSRPCQSDQA
jgi:hypothetical protein